jgi:hypothetical protein
MYLYPKIALLKIPLRIFKNLVQYHLNSTNTDSHQQNTVYKTMKRTETIIHVIRSY